MYPLVISAQPRKRSAPDMTDGSPNYLRLVGLLIGEDRGKAPINGETQGGSIHTSIHSAHVWGCYLYRQFKCDSVLFLRPIYVYMVAETLGN